MNLTTAARNTIICLVLSSALTACNGFFDKDNTPTPKPLTQYAQTIKVQSLWSTSVGKGAAGDNLKMTPSLDNAAIYCANANGIVTAIAANNGQHLWQIDTDTALTTGTAADAGLVVVGSRHGDVFALDESTGKQRWKTNVKGELLANPVISNSRVIVKTTDGTIKTLDAATGALLWSQQQSEPNLILHAASSPAVHNNAVYAGFANGNLVKMSLSSGQLDWLQPIATANGIFPIERMIDIDANPIAYQDRVYAATYQGNIAALSADSGQTLWTHTLSSYTGMDVDSNAAYITDAQGYVYSFDANSGLVNWRQTDLQYRVLTAPAIMNNTVVVADAEGYVHWLSRQDGHFMGRVSVGSPLYANPLVNNNVVYLLTNKGNLSAYQLTTS